MHLEAVIECVGRYTWGPRLNKIGGVLEVVHLEAIDLKVVNLEAVNL
jgi:hypothetical protein